LKLADARALRAAVRNAVRQNQFAALNAIYDASENGEDEGEPIEGGENVQESGVVFLSPVHVAAPIAVDPSMWLSMVNMKPLN
jgi:hypothetical protein